MKSESLGGTSSLGDIDRVDAPEELIGEVGDRVLSGHFDGIDLGGGHACIDEIDNDDRIQVEFVIV